MMYQMCFADLFHPQLLMGQVEADQYLMCPGNCPFQYRSCRDGHFHCRDLRHDGHQSSSEEEIYLFAHEKNRGTELFGPLLRCAAQYGLLIALEQLLVHHKGRRE